MQLSTDPRCLNCTHKWSDHHRRSDNGTYTFVTCQVHKPKDWDDQRKAYKHDEKCTCPGFRGARPVYLTISPDTCPHELLMNMPRCVHCGRNVPKKASH